MPLPATPTAHTKLSPQPLAAAASFRFQVGEIDCLLINDGDVHYPASKYFAHAPQDAVAAALAARGIDAERILSPYTCLLVRSGHRRVLIDTGLGEAPRDLPGQLRSHGVAPTSIDTVVVTHAHLDHLGGALTPAGAPAYPNARYVVADREWRYWVEEVDPHQDSAAHRAQAKLLPLGDQVDRITADADVAPGVRLVAAPGHTPGQLAVHLESRGQQLLYISDVLFHELHLRHPDWFPVWDRDREASAGTRRRLFDWAAAERILVHGFHFPFPGLGYVAPLQETGGWRWQPVPAP